MYHNTLKKYRKELTETLVEKEHHHYLELSKVALLKLVQIGLKEVTRFWSLESVNNIGKTRKKRKGSIFLVLFQLSIFLIYYHIILFVLGLFFRKKKQPNKSAIKFLFRPKMGKHFAKLGEPFENGEKYLVIGFDDIRRKKYKAYESAEIVLPGRSTFKGFSKSLGFIFSKFLEIAKLNGVSEFNQAELLIFGKVFIRHIYGQEVAKTLVPRGKKENSIWILENDFGIPHLAIADYFNQNQIKCAHLQHGVFFQNNLEYTPPVAQYMLCCSARNKEELSLYLPMSNIKDIGIPLQMHEVEKLEVKAPEYDYLILGKAGIYWHTSYVYRAIKDSANLLKDANVLVRHHPGADENNRTLLEKYIQNFSVSTEKKLLSDVVRADVIISFSMDALIPILYNKKKVIYIVEEEQPNIYADFHLLLPNFFIARTIEELKAGLDYYSVEHTGFSADYTDKLEYFFGFFEMEKTKKLFQEFITEVL